MILPTKGIPVHQALLPVAFQVVKAAASSPSTIGQLYQHLLDYRKSNEIPGLISFEWYVLALDVLYALGLVELRGQLIFVGAKHAAAA